MAGSVDDEDIELAHELATVATRAALPHAGGKVRYEAKNDGSPVSEADFAAEAAMLRMLSERRPMDGILTEESGQVATGRRRWLLDPIDGTVDFVAGDPDWGTHVALEVDGEIVLGVITRPLQERRWWAAKGRGAYRDSDADPLAGSTRLLCTDTTDMAGATVGLYSMGSSRVPEVLGASGASVVLHGSHILELVEGRIDAVVADCCGFAWDHAPAVILAAESAGRFTDPAGGTRSDLKGGIYSNTRLHDPISATLLDAGIRLA